eukprot:m.257649 g.257649  ORF g.257649 m.257649 type:complete len:83 (+) comp16191_c1_seq12:1084-1332(+)
MLRETKQYTSARTSIIWRRGFAYIQSRGSVSLRLYTHALFDVTVVDANVTGNEKPKFVFEALTKCVDRWDVAKSTSELYLPK